MCPAKFFKTKFYSEKDTSNIFLHWWQCDIKNIESRVKNVFCSNFLHKQIVLSNEIYK